MATTIDFEPSCSPASPASAQSSWLRPQPAWFVWGVWLAMTVGLTVFVCKYRSPDPHGEEWLMVPFMAADEPITWQALWRPINVHRIPAVQLPLILLGRWSSGDYRPAAHCLVALISAVTAGMLLAVRRMRGASDWSDAAWPLMLLHAGHFELLMNTTGLNIVAGACLGLIALAVVLSPQGLSSKGALAALAVLLVAGPLFGFSAILSLVWLAVWLPLAALAQWRWHDQAAQRRAAAWLGAALPALVLTAWYFVDFQVQKDAGRAGEAWPIVRTLLQILANGCCAGSMQNWAYVGPIVLAGGVLTLGALAWRWHACTDDRLRSSAAFCYVGAFGMMAVVVAGARSGFGDPLAGCVSRFAFMFAPIPLGLFLIALTMQSSVARVWLPRFLCGVAMLSLPSHYNHGCASMNYYSGQYAQFASDLQSGCPVEELMKNTVVLPWPTLQPMLLAMADRVHAPRYRHMQRTMPEFAARRVELRLLHANQAEVGRDSAAGLSGEWTSTGPDPYLELELPALSHPYAVRLSLRVEVQDATAPANTATQLFWGHGTEQGWTELERNRWARGTSGPAQTLTFWVNAPITRLRIDPHTGPCRFAITSIELLEPLPGPVAQTPAGEAATRR